MRQTLIRIRLDELWSLQAIDGISAMGVGFLLIPWALFGLWWAFKNLRRGNFQVELVVPVISWFVLAVIILMSPLFTSAQFIPVFGYGFMLFMGFVVGGKFAANRAERSGLNRDLIWDLGIWLFISGIVGARLFYIVQYHDRVFARCSGLGDYLKAAVNLPDGGLVFYGGMLLATVGYLAFCYTRRVSPLKLGDVAIPSVFIGLAFGRVGCFLNGCCYGDRCILPWGVTFPEGSVPFAALMQRGLLPPDAIQTFSMHPTQIYSAISALVLSLLTAAYFRYRSQDGAVVVLGLITYPIARFILEILRGDESGQFGTGLTISQVVSIGIFCIGLGMAFWLRISSSERLRDGFTAIDSRAKPTA